MKPMNQKSAIAVLTAHGWRQTIGGKHAVKMVKPTCRPITLPRHRGRDYGSVKQLLRVLAASERAWVHPVPDPYHQYEPPEPGDPSHAQPLANSTNLLFDASYGPGLSRAIMRQAGLDATER